MYSGEKAKISITALMEDLNPKIKKKYEYVLKLISDEKYQFKEPFVKHFSIERYKQLYELRLKASNTMLRIIYCVRDEDIILLHAFIKKDKRDTEQALEYSLKLIERLNEDNSLKEVIVN